MPRPPLPVATIGRIHSARRDDGLWVSRARFRDSAGHRGEIRIARKTRGAAEAALKEKAALKLGQTSAANLSSQSLVRHLAELWIQSLEESDKLKPQTVNMRARSYRNQIDPALGELYIYELTPPRLANFLMSLGRNGAKSVPLTVAVALRGICDLGVTLGVLPVSPMLGIKTSAAKRPDPISVPLEKLPEVREIFSKYVSRSKNPAAYFHLYEFDVAAGTGLRTGEMLALRDSSVAWGEPPTLTVSATIVFIKGTGTIYQDSTKTSRNRAVVLPSFSARAIRSAQELRRELGIDSPFIFPPGRHGSVRSLDFTLKAWRAILKGTPFEGLTPKSLRKTVATHLANSVDAGLAAAQLGHTTTDVTNRHYIEKKVVVPDSLASLEKFFA